MSFIPLEYGLAPSGATGLMATGTTQADALVLGGQINQFATVPANSGCVLPRVNATLTVINNGLNALNLYPSRGGQIDAGLVDAALSIAAGSQTTVSCTDNLLFGGLHTWRQIGGGGGSTFNGGTVTGATTFTNNATFTGLTSINNTDATPFTINTTMTGNPTGEVVLNQMVQQLHMTADNTNDVLSVWRMHIDTGGHTFASHHSPAIYAEASAIDTVPGGTMGWAVGLMGLGGNSGKGTVTNAVAVFAHPDFNTAGGTLTNSYGFYQESSTKAVNKYGFFTPHNSGIGTSAPVAMLELRSPDNLAGTLVFRARSQLQPIMDITADNLVTVTGSVLISNTPTIPFDVNTKISDPATAQEVNEWLTTVTLTANNSQSVFGLSSRLQTDTGGGTTVYSAQNSPAFYAQNTMIDTVAGGTISFAPAIMGVSGNNGAGNVTNAIDVMGHVAVNTGTGSVTNHYMLYQPFSNKATNEYGFFMSHKSGIGTATPTALLELRAADSLSTTVVYLARNSTVPILKIQADSSIGFNNATPITKPTVTGSKGANAALASLLTALANYGLVTDSST